MRKMILLVPLALLFSLNLTGCSLFSSGSEDQENATVAEEGQGAEGGDEFASDEFEGGEGDTAAVGDAATEVAVEGDDSEFDADAMAKDEGADGTEVASEDMEVEDSFGAEAGVDNYPDDDYSEGAKGKTAAADSEESSDDYIDDNSFATEDSLAVDEGGGLPDNTLTANEEKDLFGQAQDPIVDTPSFVDSSFGGGMDPMPEEKAPIPVKKMKDAAYQAAGANMNRLYVVRPGDNMDNIAQKIYGQDKAKDLYSYNPHFKNKTLKVGDKVYYESPNNKNDQVMMTYYEDLNIAPQFYSTSEGDNIRSLSKKLLGHERSWMEVWATNDAVESKDRMTAGIQIRYWPDGVDTQMAQVPKNNAPASSSHPEPMDIPDEVAVNDPKHAAPMGEPEEVPLDEPKEVAQLDDPKPFDEAKMDEDFNPPPTAGSMDARPPQPPPPPPAPKANFNKPVIPNPGFDKSQDPLNIVGDDSMIMGALGGLLILAAVIMLIFIRRSRSKRVNFSQTQI